MKEWYVDVILKKLKTGGSSSVPLAGQSQHQPGRQQYWAESARQLGLLDTPHGIRFAGGKPNLLFSHTAAAASAAEPTLSLAYSHAVAVTNSSDKCNYTTFSSLKEYQQQKTTHFALANNHANRPPEVKPIDLTDSDTLDSIVGDSTLVTKEDLRLVPEYLFVAMAQMKECRLTQVDRVGCYKSRPLGFVGMCCKHCGGQPGFGKFFPASVRSLAQTTTSQTMVKHISQKCRLCPPALRQAVHALLQEEEDKDNQRPRYGSRKVFFQRVWARLHNEPTIPPLPPNTSPPSHQPQPQPHQLITPNETDEDTSSSDDASSYTAHTHKRRPIIPTKQSFQRKKKQKL